MPQFSRPRQGALNVMGKGHKSVNTVLQWSQDMTHRWIHGMKEHYVDTHQFSRSAISGHLGARDFFAELMALYVNGAARLIGCGSVPGIDFDPAAEMAGPLVVNLPQGYSGTPSASALTLTSGGTAISTIPKEHVVIRVDSSSTSMTITLVNLGGLQVTLSSGVYYGTISLGGSTTIPIAATRS